MRYGSIHNGKWFRIFVLGLTLSFVLNLCACTPPWYSSPDQKNTHWLSSDPYMTYSACVLHGKSRRKWFGSGLDTFVWNGEAMPVILSFDSGFFEMIGRKANTDRYSLLSGEWSYNHNGDVIIHIETDNLTGGKYKTITMKPVGTDMEAADDFEGIYPYDKNSHWSSTDPNINIVQKYNHARDEWLPGGDTIQWDNKTHDVITVMTGDRFDIVGNYTQDCGYTEVLLSGSWEYDAAGNLILNIEKDNLMGGMYQTITLTPIGEPIDVAAS